ncbi:MAG: oligosaccharide flippase family protein [Clostridia bacterium]|nr:oligosaccharide flippase family protein [Clostridia bacterium]
MAKSEVKNGAILSYILILLNACYGLFLTPFILGRIGEADYGVYKTVAALSSSLMVLDLGLGGTLMRYIARFKADGEEEKIANYVAMSLIQAAILAAAVLFIVVGVYFFIDILYADGLTVAEIAKAKKLYIVLGIGIVAHIFENVMNGVISGYNKFTFANGLKLLRLMIRIILTIGLLFVFNNSMTLVVIDVVLIFGLLITEWFYVCFALKLKVRFKVWENKLFKESFKYTLLLFITAIAAQINGNLDNVVIGAIKGSEAVAVYSMGLLIFSMFEQLSTAISSVMLPTVTNTLKNDDEKYTQTQELIVQAGRVQFALLGAVFIGFLILGKSFVSIWLGEGYEDVYIIGLILMAPSLLELCVNVCLSVLRANNNLGFRTYNLLATTVLNAIITIVGTYFWSYYAAAIGTGVSFLLGSVIIMNVYYNKKYGFRMGLVYAQIFKGIFPCLLISGISGWLAIYFFASNLVKLLVGVTVFLLVYGLTLCLFGLNKKEKSCLKNYKDNRRETND